MCAAREGPRPRCVFGCSSIHPIRHHWEDGSSSWRPAVYEDELLHYKNCPVLWKIVEGVTTWRQPSTEAGVLGDLVWMIPCATTLEAKSGLCEDSPSVQAMAIASLIYHKIRMGYMQSKDEEIAEIVDFSAATYSHMNRFICTVSRVGIENRKLVLRTM